MTVKRKLSMIKEIGPGFVQLSDKCKFVNTAQLLFYKNQKGGEC